MVTCGAVEGLLKKQGMHPHGPQGYTAPVDTVLKQLGLIQLRQLA
jgi:hypothetical protein